VEEALLDQWLPASMDEGREDVTMWKPLEVACLNATAPPVHVLEEGFDDEDLNRLVADVMRASNERLTERLVDDETLHNGFKMWYNDEFLQRRHAVASNKHVDPLVHSLVTNVIRPNHLPARTVRALHSWLVSQVAPRIHVHVDELSVFARRLNERGDLVLGTVVCYNPLRTFFHIPAIHACKALTLDPSLVCRFDERFELNPATDVEERCFRHWWDADKMRELCSVVRTGARCIAFSAFIDDTSVVEYHGRSVTPIMLMPMNLKDGTFEVVGFVPYVSDEDALASGIKKTHIPLLRSSILQKCISVLLMYGLMRTDSPEYMSDQGSVRNVLASLRLDHKARLEALALVGLSRVVETRNPACRCHEIRSSALNRVVADCDEREYRHNDEYRRTWLDLLRKLESPVTKKEAAAMLVQLGQRPIRPALFDAFAFDGAVDTPEDVHHLGPLGIGQFLLSNLSSALREAFPSTRVQGHAKKDFFPATAHGGPYLALSKGEDVTWDEYEAEHVKDKHVWATTASGSCGFVLLDRLLIDRQHDYDHKFALNQVDEALRRMGRAYVRSYMRFDFPSLADLAEKSKWKGGSEDSIDVFSRATTTELVLLYITYALPSIVRKEEFVWITSTFLLYNKLYWSWRREAFFESDFAVCDKHRIELKTLMMRHWAKFSRTSLCTAKFHALDHIVLDVRRHGVPRHTGSGPGDHAHIEQAKKPFKWSSKTKDQDSLNKQLIEFGCAPPSFVTKLRGAARAKRDHQEDCVRGKGSAKQLLNHYIVEQVRALRLREWGVRECNVPVNALDGLRDLCMRRFGLCEGLTEFSRREVTLYHSAVLRSGVEIFASDSFHKQPRHDFLLLYSGQLIRAVALVELTVHGESVVFLLAEATVEQADEELEMLECTVVSEGDEWSWVSLSDVKQPVCALPHAFDKAWHFLIRDKHEERVWE
jgi:hypothetical protein